MALYKIQVFKTRTGDRFWTNVYHVNATTLDAAVAHANVVIAAGEATLMDGSFSVVKTIVSDVVGDEFRTTPMSLPGQLSGADFLPLFNTVKVNISVAGNGRNDYKFYRGGVLETNQTTGQLAPATMTAYSDMVQEFIDLGAAAGVDMVDSDGNDWILASTQQLVQMRQLHRKRKKVVTP